MALSITVFPNLQLRQGEMPQAPMLAPGIVNQTVGLAAQSTAIAGPCLICVTAGEAQRVTVQRTPGYVAPVAGAGVLLQAAIERYFELPSGSWYLNVVAG